jgi:hypothetical protein
MCHMHWHEKGHPFRGANLLIQRVFAEVIGKPLFRALIFPYFLFLFSVSTADAVTNWEATRRQIAVLSPATKTLLFVSLIGGWCLVAGRALRPVWRHRTIPLLVRQPMGSWQWSARLLPSLSIALLPVVLIWWLASYGANPLTHYLGFVGLALPIVLGASFREKASAVIMCAGVTALACLIFAYSINAAWAYLGIVATPVLYGAASARIRNQLSVQDNLVHRQLSSASVIRVLVSRDWRCILRTRQQTLIELIVINFGVVMMMLAFRINGRDSGRDTLLIACIMFLIAAVPAFKSLEIAKTRLGAQFMRREWPVTIGERSMALISLTAVVTAPSALPIALLGSRMGIFNLLVFVVFVLATIIIEAALFATTLRRSSSAVGLYLNSILLHGILISILTPWQYVPISIAGIAAGFSVMKSGLRRFV